MGSTLPATLLVGMVPVQVPRAPPTKVCAAVLVRFAGRASVKRMSVSPSAFGLVIVKVTIEVPPVAIELGAKVLVIVGGAYTIRFAVAAAPGFAAVCVLVTVLVVFGCPVATLMTLEVTGDTVMVQVSPAFSVLSDSVKLVLPATTLVGVTTPAQVSTTAGAAPSAMFTSGSLHTTVVSAVPAFGLVSVNWIEVVPPVWIEPGTKFLVSTGGESTTRFAVLDAAPATGVCVEVDAARGVGPRARDARSHGDGDRCSSRSRRAWAR